MKRAMLLALVMGLAAVAFGQADPAPAHRALVPMRFAVLSEAEGKGLPCRVHLRNTAGRPVQPEGLPFWKDHFVCPGLAEFKLAPGDYHYEIERGPEYVSRAGQFTVMDSGSQAVTNVLPRLVDLAREGWWSGE